MFKILMLGFLVFSSALGVEIVGDHIREMASPIPAPTVMGVQSSRTSFSNPKTSVSTVKQTTTIPKIDCTGPDGVVFKTTQKECDEFNAAWGKTQITNSTATINTMAQTVNCFYKSEGGVILYDYGVVSSQRCKELSDSWWNKKQNDLSSQNAQNCIDTAKSHSENCYTRCSADYPPGSGYDGYANCLNACDSVFQTELAACR